MDFQDTANNPKIPAGRSDGLRAQHREEAFLAPVLPQIQAGEDAADRDLLARIRKALEDPPANGGRSKKTLDGREGLYY